LAHAQRSKPVDFLGIAYIAYIAFKVNLVLYFNGVCWWPAPLGRRRLAWHNLARIVSAAGRQALGYQALGRQPVAFGPPARHHSAAGRRPKPAGMVQRSMGVGGGGPCKEP